MRKFIGTLLCLTLLAKYQSVAQMINKDSEEKYYVGHFDRPTYLKVKQLLANRSDSLLGDTIIIKYDYNNETCWNSLDQAEGSYIEKIVEGRHRFINEILSTRPNISFFHFREPGININRVTKLDTTIRIDTAKQLKRVLFKKKSTCGNSLILLPDGKFIIIRSDSHFDALQLDRDKIKSLIK